MQSNMIKIWQVVCSEFYDSRPRIICHCFWFVKCSQDIFWGIHEKPTPDGDEHFFVVKNCIRKTTTFCHLESVRRLQRVPKNIDKVNSSFCLQHHKSVRVWKTQNCLQNIHCCIFSIKTNFQSSSASGCHKINIFTCFPRYWKSLTLDQPTLF
jgi:hypothetical protein